VRRPAVVLLLWLASCATPQAAPLLPAAKSGFTFALVGDTPYSAVEASALDGIIREMNGEELGFVIHVGDITAGNGPCTDDWFEARKRQFDGIRHPFIIVPGDNDWVDCYRSGFDPIERLKKFRALFESGDASLGGQTIPLERQSGRYSEYREHMRWVAADVLFVGLNVQGSNNNLGRTPAMDAEYGRRMAAVFAWLDDSVALAQRRRLAGMVIFTQADPDFEGKFKRRPGTPDGFAEFRKALLAAALKFGKPILFVNGDTHLFRLDHPLRDPASGRPLENFTRVIVFGSPFTRWVRAGIDPSSPQLFEISRSPLPGR
jgi:predicted phosphodiesterase